MTQVKIGTIISVTYWGSTILKMFIKNAPYKKTGLVFIITYLAYTSIYISRLNLSIASPELSGQGILTAAQIGLADF